MVIKCINNESTVAYTCLSWSRTILDSPGFSLILILSGSWNHCASKMSNMNCYYLLPFLLRHFLSTMSVEKRTLFLVWHEEAIPIKKFLTMENFVFDTVLKGVNYTQEEKCEIGKKLLNFTSRLVVKWKNCRRNKLFFENDNKE